ncbi:hypothetical protein PoB_004538800 [Plakobranchus ocellatus]|uniref:Ataxin-2 C-terminal domain-containing protein n=1 Tax=Plakobranchus ocellatus TaxID=259542 RepID=A0AAV4BJ96_9GAST|nr:hypothetical protein PoB_004538800 [Plakobranchus ocellatus]
MSPPSGHALWVHSHSLAGQSKPLPGVWPLPCISSIRGAIQSILSLKEANWNRNVPSPAKNATETAINPNNFQSQEPVFYNAEGKVCSRKEANVPEPEPDEDQEEFYILNEEEAAAFEQFEAEQKQCLGDFSNHESCSNDAGYDSYNYGECGGDGGMGEELEAYYEEFLKSLPQVQYQPQYQQHLQHQQIQHSMNYAPQALPNQGMYFSYGAQQPPPSHDYSHYTQQYTGHMQPPTMGVQQQQQQQHNQFQQHHQYQQSPQQPPYPYNHQNH